MAVSFEGTRQRAMQRWPAARVCLRAERPTPVLAPKKAMVLMLVVAVVMVVMLSWFFFSLFLRNEKLNSSV